MRHILIISAVLASLLLLNAMFQNPIEAESPLTPETERVLPSAPMPSAEPPAPSPTPPSIAIPVVRPTIEQDPVVNGLLRICVSEAGFFGHKDCVGIWQVIQNVRSRSCRSTIRRITECDENGETILSAMRRLSPISMKQRRAPTARKRYIQSLTVACEEPPGFQSAARGAQWENYREPCLELAALADALVKGTHPDRFPVPSVIAWGGRCEVQGGACDDAIACRRGLARVNSDTRNAFWCTPGARGCAAARDPICESLGL